MDGDNDREKKYKRNQTAMLKDWKILLKDVYELCFTLTSPSSELENQKYYDFVCFILNSSERIKNVLGQETSLNSFLKSALTKATPKKDIAEKYIV